MKYQVNKEEHFHHLLLFAFNQAAKAIEAARKICEEYDKYAMPLRMVKNWFKIFKNGDSKTVISTIEASNR
ncbi:hypothetical protein X975_25743, partial [Stegodyphus mimosarum]